MPATAGAGGGPEYQPLGQVPSNVNRSGHNEQCITLRRTTVKDQQLKIEIPLTHRARRLGGGDAEAGF